MRIINYFILIINLVWLLFIIAMFLPCSSISYRILQAGTAVFIYIYFITQRAIAKAAIAICNV